MLKEIEDQIQAYLREKGKPEFEPSQPGPYVKREAYEFKVPENVRLWAKDMERWGKAVRRDILVLEYHVKQKYNNVTDDKMYGDPGDPPPPPPE